ncbi:hypothetical protein IV203_035938 [Nitzschia inconspicua]|uniref:Senescence domain-containing protein n=1 Tax=Nitzschia inconspicua TaxID=303405 RepID=A0A9K3PXL1_9STRA|nr:hypothetical protein IV203_035938 [Nitzschia inconspicua]
MEESCSIRNAMTSPDGRKKKSYLNSRERQRGVTVKRASDVKDSISKFLDTAQHEDSIFDVGTGTETDQNNGFTISTHGRQTGGQKSRVPSRSDHLSNIFPISPMDGCFASKREMPFDRRTSLRKSPSHTKPKMRRKASKRRPVSSEEVAVGNDDDDDDDLESFAVDDDDDDVSLSSDEYGGRSRTSNRPTHQYNSAGPLHMARSNPPSRTVSANSRLDPLVSSSRLPPRRAQSMKSGQMRRRNSISGLASGLGTIDRNSRVSSIRNKHRSRSSLSRNDDDCDSVTSGMSIASTRSRRNTGLEGGALNAFLGDEAMVRNASRGKEFYSGATVASSSADEQFLRDRKARQDLILDVAQKERWRFEEQSREQDEMSERLNDTPGEAYDDDSDGDSLHFGKKKGIMGNLKRAVRKSAKITKSGAKGTVNVVKDPKRAAKKVGDFAKDVGKETTKMVLDPSLAAKRTAKGVKDTVKLTTKVTNTVAKGSYGMTKSIAKTGVKGTSMVVGKTIDGVVYGATGLFIKKDGATEGSEYEEYDPSVLTNRRRRDTLVDRFVEDEDKKAREVEALRSSGIPSRTPDILAPTINIGGGGGSWDV